MRCLPLYSSYLFHNWDVFDLLLLFMSAETTEIIIAESRKATVRVLRESALTSRPTASQTRFSLGSEASVSVEGPRFPTMEENRTPSFFSWSLLSPVLKVGSQS